LDLQNDKGESQAAKSAVETTIAAVTERAVEATQYKPTLLVRGSLYYIGTCIYVCVRLSRIIFLD